MHLPVAVPIVLIIAAAWLLAHDAPFAVKSFRLRRKTLQTSDLVRAPPNNAPCLLDVFRACCRPLGAPRLQLWRFIVRLELVVIDNGPSYDFHRIKNVYTLHYVYKARRSNETIVLCPISKLRSLKCKIKQKIPEPDSSCTKFKSTSCLLWWTVCNYHVSLTGAYKYSILHKILSKYSFSRLFLISVHFSTILSSTFGSVLSWY